MRHRKMTLEYDFENYPINSEGGCYVAVLQRGNDLLEGCLAMYGGRTLFGAFTLYMPDGLNMEDGSAITWFCNTWKKNRALAGFPVRYIWTAFGSRGKVKGYHVGYFANCGYQGKAHHDYAARETWYRIIQRPIDDDDAFSNIMLGEAGKTWSDQGIIIDTNNALHHGAKTMVMGTISCMAQCSRMHDIPPGVRLFSSSQLPDIQQSEVYKI